MSPYRPRFDDRLAGEVRAFLDLPGEVAALRAEVRRLAEVVEALRQATPPVLVPFTVAAERLGVSVSTITRRVRDGTIPTRRVGRRSLVDLAALHPLSGEQVAQAAAEARREPAPPPAPAPGVP